MAPEFDVTRIAEELRGLLEAWGLHLNRPTAEVQTVPVDRDLAGLDPDDDAPRVEGPDGLELPDRFEIDPWSIP